MVYTVPDVKNGVASSIASVASSFQFKSWPQGLPVVAMLNSGIIVLADASPCHADLRPIQPLFCAMILLCSTLKSGAILSDPFLTSFADRFHVSKKCPGQCCCLLDCLFS